MKKLSKKQIIFTTTFSVLISSFFVFIFVSAQSYIKPDGVSIPYSLRGFENIPVPPVDGGIADSGLISGWKNIGESGISLITREGNVGIGVEIPIHKLQVDSNSSASAICLPLTPGGAVECRGAWDRFGTTLVNGTHTASDCLSAGGLVQLAGGATVCNFKGLGVSCPSGWTQYQSWSATVDTRCDGTMHDGCALTGPDPGNPDLADSCLTGSHNWSDVAPESCIFHDRSGGCGGINEPECTITEYGIAYCTLTNPQICTAKLIEIACY